LNNISKATFATTFLTGIVGSIKKVEKNDKMRIYMRMATHRKYKKEETTDWHNIVFYGRLAEIIDAFVDKGQKISVEGEMEVWDFTNEDGTTTTKNYVNANSMKFKSDANMTMIGFITSFYRENESSPLYMKILTKRKVFKDNEKIDKDDIHKIIFYGNLADTIEEVAKKNKKIAIIGNIEVENKDGQESTYIRARRAKFL
jgi:single-strand DNA-binding protein